MCVLLVLYKTSEQLALGMYAKYSVQPSETPSKRQDVNVSIPTRVPKQILPEEGLLCKDFFLPVL